MKKIKILIGFLIFIAICMISNVNYAYYKEITTIEEIDGAEWEYKYGLYDENYEIEQIADQKIAVIPYAKGDRVKIWFREKLNKLDSLADVGLVNIYIKKGDDMGTLNGDKLCALLKYSTQDVPVLQEASMSIGDGNIAMMEGGFTAYGEKYTFVLNCIDDFEIAVGGEKKPITIIRFVNAARKELEKGNQDWIYVNAESLKDEKTQDTVTKYIFKGKYDVESNHKSSTGLKMANVNYEADSEYETLTEEEKNVVQTNLEQYNSKLPEDKQLIIKNNAGNEYVDKEKSNIRFSHIKKFGKIGDRIYFYEYIAYWDDKIKWIIFDNVSATLIMENGVFLLDGVEKAAEKQAETETTIEENEDLIYEALKNMLDLGDPREEIEFIDVLTNTGEYLNVGAINSTDAQKVEERATLLLTTITNIAMIVSILMLAVLGVKYMLGSVEEKADFKKDMIPYLVGAILVFGIAAITKALQAWGQTINNI